MSANLQRYTPPPPPEPESCASCKCMRPECITPYGDGALTLCWLCAHLVVEHDHVPGMAVTDCGCKSADIYPADYRAKFDRPQPPTSGEITVRTPGPDGLTLVQTFERIDERTTRGEYAMRPVRAEYVERPKFIGRDSTRALAQRDARRERVMRMSMKGER